ncbi:MAG: discoidin domain-containing protein [Thermoguttaceae bacterium]|nr:discoidin domain-containing protein [Thermoguttaceae bacterium]MDW8039506.1 hypothetical protein [Thermoguttaceae bacterium]
MATARICRKTALFVIQEIFLRLHAGSNVGMTGVLVLSLLSGFWSPCLAQQASASSTAQGTSPAGAIDKDRFNVEPAHLWKGVAGPSSWWWQVRFDEPRPIGAILQVLGAAPLELRNAPLRYVWQVSQDGQT